jgi:CRISPR-associated endonuclease/helicase Cas3
MKPYQYQQRLAKAIRQGKSIILQAPTGAGKTFASLLPYLQAWTHPTIPLPRKCIYSVPMKVLATQFTEEFNQFVREKMKNVANVPDVKIQTGEHRRDPEFRADMTFATIDQLLSSWLMHPYSLSYRKGNMNAGALVGSYLIFDEFHLFDPDSTLPTTLHMLKTLQGISPFVLMTATFSQVMLGQLGALLGAETFVLTDEELREMPAQNKQRRFHLSDTLLVEEGVPNIEPITTAHEAQTGKYQRSLVIFNQVERAQRFYEALRAYGKEKGIHVRLLHSRFRPADRQKWENEVRQEFGKDEKQYTQQSMIVVATQVVEVGLDMTCPVLHTERAPAAAILQRAGRCARYEGESGDVYVYQVEHLAPYHGKESEAQNERTWAWLADNQNRHLAFQDEQDLINVVHTPTDQKILDTLSAGDIRWGEKVEALWRGDGSKVEARRLIRDIQSQSLLVHAEPDKLLHQPFATELFSLHPKTLLGKFESWQEAGEETFEKEGLPWVVCRLEESKDDDQAQGNRPIQYAWQPVRHKAELCGAQLLAVNPALVGYREDLGLMLYAGNSYQSPIPTPTTKERFTISYKLETYTEHIRLVYEALQAEINSQQWQSAARQLEKAAKWHTGTLTDLAQLVAWAHDLGKLNQKWQSWATQWQHAIELPYDKQGAYAHTDYDSENMTHRAQDKLLQGKRPPHAVESALAALPFLAAVVGKNRELIQAGFTAIARHHAPFSHEAESFVLVDGYEQWVAETMGLLPAFLQEKCRQAPIQLVYKITPKRSQRLTEGHFFIDLKNPFTLCAYFLLVRVLRYADQEGTKKGAR